MGTGGWVCPPLCDTSMECADERGAACGRGWGGLAWGDRPQRLQVGHQEPPRTALPAPLEDEEMPSSFLRSFTAWPHCADGETEALEKDAL